MDSSVFIRNDGGNLVRMTQAIDGFRAKYGEWPTKLIIDESTLATLIRHLTPLGFYLLQVKLEIVIADNGIVTQGKHDKKFDYGTEGWEAGTSDISARLWLGWGNA